MFRIRILCLFLTVLCSGWVVAAPLPPGVQVRLGTTDLWHGPSVQDLAFAPDGKTFYSLGSADAAARQWDATTGKELRAFAADKGRLTAFALSRDGRLLATAADDRIIRIWNTATGEVITSWTRKLAPSSIAFAPDSKSLAVLPGDEPESVAVIESASGKELHTFKVDSPLRGARGGGGIIGLLRGDVDNSIPGTLVFSPDGRFIAVHASQTVTLWDTMAHKRVRQYNVTRVIGGGGPGGGGGGLGRVALGALGGYGSLQFAADSQTLLVANGAGGVHRWEITSIDALDPLAASDAGCVSVGGGAVAAAGRLGLTLWDADGKRLHQQLTPDTAALTAVACTPDGKTAVTGDALGRLRVWDVATGKERLLTGPRPVFRTLAVTANGAVTGDEYGLHHWDATGKETKRIKLDPESVADLLLSPDGRTLVMRRTEGEIRLLDATTGETRATLEAKNRKLTTLQFSADGRWLAALDPGTARRGGRGAAAVATPGATVILYDVRTGKEVRQFASIPRLGDSFVFLPDGRTLMTTVSGDSLCLWETLTGKPRRVLSMAAMDNNDDYRDYLDDLLGGPIGVAVRGGADALNFILRPQLLAVSPDGRTVAAVQRTTVSLVDLRTGKRLARLEDHTGIVTCVAYSPNGQLLVTGGSDQAVRLWDGVTGKEIGALSGHRGPLRSVWFAPDGKTLVTAADDQTALIWNVADAVAAAQPTGRHHAPAPRPLEELWTDLAGDNAQKADTALRELESRPGDALPLLKERLRPAMAADAKKVAKWVAELDADDFAARERAAAELEKAGEQARANLEASLKNQPSQELKRRVTELLKKLDERAFSTELVRDLRALEVVEKIGGVEAVKLLEAMASGAANDPRTQDAKAALERLKRK